MRNLPPIVKVLIAAFVVFLIGIVLTKIKPEKKLWNHSTKLHIAVSFYPLGEFAQAVGGERVEIKVITPPGTESHDFEPTTQDIDIVTTADVFVYNGVNFDPWAEKLAKSTTNVSLNASQFVQVKDNDPHFWLDPLLAIKIVDGITEELIQLDPQNKKIYIDNAQKYTDDLRDLNQSYQKGLEDCQNRNIVVSHDAFSYLTDRYNINSLVISGISPEEEPSPRYMAQIADEAKRLGIKYIFFESLVSPKLSETIAQEIGAQTLVLNPVEGLTQEDRSVGRNYITIMKANLENLRKAMQCK